MTLSPLISNGQVGGVLAGALWGAFWLGLRVLDRAPRHRLIHAHLSGLTYTCGMALFLLGTGALECVKRRGGTDNGAVFVTWGCAAY